MDNDYGTFERYMRKCDGILNTIVGLTSDDLDAEWRGEYDAGTEPKQAVYNALMEYHDFPDGIWLADRLGIS